MLATPVRSWCVLSIGALALLASFSSFTSVHAQVKAEPRYTAAVVYTSMSGTTASLTARASVQNYGGKEEELYVKFIWGDGTEDLVQAKTLPGYYKSSKTITISSIARTHTYSSDASYPITMKFYRGSKKGAESYPKEMVSFTLRTENTDALCRNGIDDDRDAKRDALDTDCARFMIAETTLELCSDGIDNDLNGATDLADLSCRAYLPPEDTQDMCSDSIDNDKDGATDPYDSDCAAFVPEENTIEACFDNADNDLDGAYDLSDEDCALFLVPENTPELCSDSIDNDMNGLMDGLETSCKEHLPTEDTDAVCLDGIDNDRDGSYDWLDEDCAPYAEAPMCGQGFQAMFWPGFGWACIVGYNLQLN